MSMRHPDDAMALPMMTTAPPRIPAHRDAKDPETIDTAAMAVSNHADEMSADQSR